MPKFFKAIQRTLLKCNVNRFITFGYHSELPQRRLLVGYAAYALVGALLLTLPFSIQVPVTLQDHLFTAISALSTTGLSTVDIGTHYTFFGQLVILLLIQLGGLGYMTLTSFLFLGTHEHLNREQNKMMDSQFSLPDNMSDPRMVRQIVGFTFLFEALGVAFLFPYFYIHHMEQPLWSAVFHTVSAFCTAGFSLYADNLCGFRSDVYVNTVIMALGYMGSLGFIFMTDVKQKIRHRSHPISFTTKVIVAFTAGLSLLTATHLYLTEPSIQVYPPGERFMVSLFQSMSAMTTAGFNTIDLSGIVPISLLVMSMTMYIGASPSGTGGGLKSTTIAAIFAYTRSKLRKEPKVTLCGHTIQTVRLNTALTTMIFYSFILFAGVYGMALCEPPATDCQLLLFEATSALATTGLSTGVLSHMSNGSIYIVMALMFIGRVGVITFGNALLADRHPEPQKTDKEDLVI